MKYAVVVVGFILGVAAGWTQADDPFGTLEQELRARDWDQASATVERFSAQMKDCPTCTSHLRDLKGAVRNRDRDSALNHLQLLRAHHRGSHAGRLR